MPLLDHNGQEDELITSIGAGVPRTLPRVLPVLPIRDTVYFPYMLFPLFLGREKSIRALDHALARNRYVLLAAQKDISVEDPTPDDIFSVGIIAEVLQVLRVPDGTVRVTLEGIERARIGQFVHEDPFFKARVKVLKAKRVGGVRVEALMRSVVALFDQVVQNQVVHNGRPIPPEILINVASIEEPGKLADSIIPHLPLKTEIKQDMLETANIAERLDKLNVLLEKEMEVINIQRNIRSRVEKEMGDVQREYILREQLKAIQQELGERDGRLSEIEEYKARIDEAGMPEDVRERASKELERLDKMPYAAPEGVVIRNYLDWLIALPWMNRTQDSLDLDQAESVLEEDHYGLKKVKERVIEFLAVRKLTEEMKGPILCFVGPPGVGKTSIGKSIARSLGRKFYRLSLGGVRDEAEIRGHRRTYVGALPGRILQGVRTAGTRNPVFMLDEIDKIGVDFRGDPSSALLEALDPEQNNAFSDHYLEVPFDLKDVMFITTANVLDTIPPALLDRMEIIYFSGYIEDEKMQIARRFLVPKQLRENGLTPKLLAIDDSALRLLVREYTREAGVRNLEREIASICRKVAKQVASSVPLTQGEGKPPARKRITVRDKDVKGYLGSPRYRYGRAETGDEAGIATGLAYTEFGGDIISVEVALMPGDKGTLTLTGQLGDVMKESAQAALTYVRSRAGSLCHPSPSHHSGDSRHSERNPRHSELDSEPSPSRHSGDSRHSERSPRHSELDSEPSPSRHSERSEEPPFDETFYSHTDIHVHVPAGAVPKDGPSAGVTIATAIASALTKRPVRSDIAMTGEITLRGRVLPVGGIKEKILAAHRAGIRTVIMPKENEPDLEDIPTDVRNEMTFHFVTHADEVLEKALLPATSL